MTSIFLRTDVTSVKLFKNYILSGIGSELNIFDRETFKLLLKLDTLNGQKIYGIIPSKCDCNILIYGGKQLAVASFTEREDSQATCSAPVICDDWLHSGVWVNKTDVAVLTAHNVVQIWDTQNWCLKSKHESKYNSILYSGLLAVLNDDTLIFSGTVYSEVIIQTVKLGPVHFLKGHNGVIFSITYDPVKEIIVTTSDDRSVRIWKIQNDNNLDHKLNSYWQNINIECIHELYGHTARVMRSHISEESIISVGEDSGICFWGYNGSLLRRIMSHQNSSIWSVHADEKHLVTGGGDGATILHPLGYIDEYKNSEIITIDADTPKKLQFTARKNIVMVNECNDFVYYDVTSKVQMKHELSHESTYKMLDISACKQIIAVSDMKGNLDVFIENCKGEAEIHKIIGTKLNIGKVLSMHLAGNRHLIFCSDSGIVNIVAATHNAIEIISSHILPPCKERWLTAAAMDIDKKLLLVGDRCGNIHVYNNGVKNPVKTFNKVHGRYGATSINIRDKEITTTGRDGSIKYFSIHKDKVKYMSSKNVEFQWVEKFIDKNDKYICGFQERIFVVYSLDNNVKLIEANCGGGHRSWDAVRFVDKINDCYDEVIKLVYVKNSDIHLNTFLINRIVSQNVIHGTHSNAINCLKTVRHRKDGKTIFFVSGGEDTTLRISKLDYDGNFKDDFIFKHLSSIRTVKTANLDDDGILLLSAGGRAQICAKILDVKETKIVAEEIVDFLIKGTDKERKGNQNWKSVTVDFDPETRVMDLEVIKAGNGFKIFAACSDAYLRVFELNENKLSLVNNIKHHNSCILKTHSLNINNMDIVVTCTTRGDLTFWNASNDIIFSTNTNKSGINCISSAIISDKRFVIATGGDDNSIHVMLLEFNSTMKIIAQWTSSQYHCSQITGVIFVADLLVSTSIDQRVTLLKWSIKYDEEIKCDFVSQSFCNVGDIHGMDLLEYNNDSVVVCVFGKGMEVISIAVNRC